MNIDKEELLLDLLCKKAVYGLDDRESTQLEQLESESGENSSIELTVAALGLIDLDTTEEMPANLQAKIVSDARGFFESEGGTSLAAQRGIVFQEPPAARSWFAWLGWAVAAAACLVLTINLFTTRDQNGLAGVKATPTPPKEEKLDPAQQRESLIKSSENVLVAKLGKGTVKEIADVSGDVVWSDARQAGYVRIKGLPQNDINKATYQLWIFEENQGSKTPIDGGTFDINSDGEVIIPIDAKLKAKSPSMFAVTIEKPGGVVVSDRGKIAALAKIETQAG